MPRAHKWRRMRSGGVEKMTVCIKAASRDKRAHVT